MDIRELPKIELHTHLDCSLSFPLVRRLNPAISHDDFEQEFIAPRKCQNLADFLTRIDHSLRLMQSAESLQLATADLFDQLKMDNVLYAEIRFAPLLHTQSGLAPQAVVEAVLEEMTESINRSGVQARLLLCTLRHFSEEQGMTTVRLAHRYRDHLIAGLDLAADEAGFPLDAHIPAFRFAMDQGILRTAHAGEACGAESMWETLERLLPHRIGHGVRSIEDPELVEFLAGNGIHLEVCPTCNIQTNVFSRYRDHPVPRFFEAGVSVGINTDARTVSNVTLSEEYFRLHKHFGWGMAEFYQINLNALNAAFIPEEEKRQLIERLTNFYSKI